VTGLRQATLDVWTNGTVMPDEAFYTARQDSTEHLCLSEPDDQ
jgi:DNA-directed RNA polymerase alpha subunit